MAIGVYVIINVCFGFIYLAALESDAIVVGLCWMNPVWLYNHIRVNVFGAIFVALIAGVVLAPYAVCYWIYKLCVVGRK